MCPKAFAGLQLEEKENGMKEKQCISKELEQEVRSAVSGASSEDRVLGSFHGGSAWDSHPSLYSPTSWLADTSSLTLAVQQITSVSTV